MKKVLRYIIIIIITALLAMLSALAVYNVVKAATSVMDCTVSHNPLNELVEETKADGVWVAEDILDDSRCYVYWASCEELKMCVRVAAVCYPEQAQNNFY